MAETFVATAGWSIPRVSSHRLPPSGTHLAGYASVLNAVEINSSFHRPHRAGTYAKWAAATPPGFKFAVKMPRTITHDRALRRSRVLLATFLDECSGLGTKLGPLLLQLPPGHAFDRRVTARFLELLRGRFTGPVVCEPRHPSWLSAGADDLLVHHLVARVAADPARAPGLERPGGWPGILYLRLHGSPRTYWSTYERERLDRFTEILQHSTAPERWCVFDNTASGAALDNALDLTTLLSAWTLRPCPS